MAALALFIAPGAALRVYRLFTRRIRVVCEPRLRGEPAPLKTYNLLELVRRLQASPTASIGHNHARIWDLWFENKSARVFDLRIFVFTAGQPNWVRAAKVHAPEDSGLKVSSKIDGGLLTIVADRFHQTRILPVSVVLKRPDRPIFFSSSDNVLARYQFKRGAVSIYSQDLFRQHDRLILFTLWYAGAIAIVMIRLLWLALDR